ncbi:hypothetical protein J5X84_27410 [Streptosporangiaceae bacterium NEAU-GS5]|nr:hypothetical protein [Streptosporangiaceae bacterium NEAU-GS5]
MNNSGILGRTAVAATLAMGMGVGVALAGAPSASASVAVADQKGGKFGPFGYGGLKLGLSAKKAKATKKIVRVKGDAVDHKYCTGWTLKRHGKGPVDLYISKKLGVAVIFAPKGVKTPQGIKIGSTLKQVKKAYPKLETHPGENPYADAPGNSKAYYYFNMYKGKVYELSLVLRGQDCIG